MYKNSYAVIDLGNTKTVCVIGGVPGNSGMVDVAGQGISCHKGMNRGIIIDINEIADSLYEAVMFAEKEANAEIKSAYVNISPNHARIISRKVIIPITDSSGVITENDMDRLFLQIKEVALESHEKVIDIVIKEYSVDSYSGIVDPVGMSAAALGAEAVVVIGEKMYTQAINRAFDKLNIKIDGMIFEPLAYAGTVLTDEERENGVLLFDVGGCTDISIFYRNEIIYSESLPIGGKHITGDISICMKISVSDAEKIKQKYELALTELIENDQEEYLRDSETHEYKSCKVSEVIDIIEARLQDILLLARHSIEQSGFIDVPLSIVLVGSGIHYMAGVDKIAEAVFGIPVKLASNKSIGYNTSEFGLALSMIYNISTRDREGENGSIILTEADKAMLPQEGYKEVIRRVKSFYITAKKRIKWFVKHIF